MCTSLMLLPVATAPYVEVTAAFTAAVATRLRHPPDACAGTVVATAELGVEAGSVDEATVDAVDAGRVALPEPAEVVVVVAAPEVVGDEVEWPEPQPASTSPPSPASAARVFTQDDSSLRWRSRVGRLATEIISVVSMADRRLEGKQQILCAAVWVGSADWVETTLSGHG